MVKNLDVLRVVGADAHAKATLISDFSECSRLYGAGASFKLFRGTVVEMQINEINRRHLTSLLERWYLPGRELVKKLGLGSVKAGGGLCRRWSRTCSGSRRMQPAPRAWQDRRAPRLTFAAPGHPTRVGFLLRL